MSASPKQKYEDDSVNPQIWLAGILRTRFDKIVELYYAPLEHPRTEGVHDMRVAIRRLRSALRNCAQLTDKFRLKRISKRLKLLGDQLGAVRDLDVAIHAFSDASKNAADPEIKKGILDIVEDCKTRRRVAYKHLRKHLTKEELTELIKQFDRAFDRSLRQREMFAAVNIEQAARAVIENCLDRFLADVDAIYDPFAVRQIHRLRISGKHLRYSIELFEDLWDGKLRPFAEETKKMQSYLGEIHDRDFWIAGSGKRISAERPQSKNEELVYQARIWLLSEFTRQRMHAYRNALATWSTWRTMDLPGQLRKVVSG